MVALRFSREADRPEQQAVGWSVAADDVQDWSEPQVIAAFDSPSLPTNSVVEAEADLTFDAEEEIQIPGSYASTEAEGFPQASQIASSQTLHESKEVAQVVATESAASEIARAEKVVATLTEVETETWAAAIPTKVTSWESESVVPTSQESVLEDWSNFENGFESETSSSPENAGVFATPEPESELRIAALPTENDKPKFKKFGAAKSKSKSASGDEDDHDHDDDDEDDPPTKQPVVLSASNRWKLAGAPKKGDRYKDDTPLTDDCSVFIEDAHGNFSPTPTMPEIPYDPYGQMNVYEGKQLYANQRPLLELGRPWYQLGPISEGSSILGFHNNVNPQYLIFGDARSAFASNNNGGESSSLVASQLNMFHHFKFTSTERFVAFTSPLTRGGNNTRYIFDDDEFESEANANINFAYFEGDLGAIAGGAMGETLPFDLPFAMGIMPLVFQNGIWMEDEILGFAVTIPARNSPRFDISNMDITFFAGYDKLDSPAFVGDDSAARVMGIATFLDALNGHFEIDYAFLDDRTFQDRSYHNIGIGYTRRYGRFLSNSTRVIVNAGQQNGTTDSADGVLLLSENSLITGHPSTVVPYLNMFAGFDNPQSVGRNAAAGGILRNTGILFESDNLTGYPTLDATANDTFGMAMGLNLLADEFAQQLIVEMAMLGVMGDDANRNARGDQYGVGVRYQLPLTNSVIFRADAMVGFLRDDEDINGGRMEIRKKF